MSRNHSSEDVFRKEGRAKGGTILSLGYSKLENRKRPLAEDAGKWILILREKEGITDMYEPTLLAQIVNPDRLTNKS